MKKVNKDSKKVNGINKNDNSTITLKIDADIEDYLKNIAWISFLESRVETNMSKYLNNLVRQEMLRLLELTDKDTPEKIKSKWYEYKKKNNL